MRQRLLSVPLLLAMLLFSDTTGRAPQEVVSESQVPLNAAVNLDLIERLARERADRPYVHGSENLPSGSRRWATTSIATSASGRAQALWRAARGCSRCGSSTVDSFTAIGLRSGKPRRRARAGPVQQLAVHVRQERCAGQTAAESRFCRAPVHYPLHTRHTRTSSSLSSAPPISGCSAATRVRHLRARPCGRYRARTGERSSPTSRISGWCARRRRDSVAR